MPGFVGQCMEEKLSLEEYFKENGDEFLEAKAARYLVGALGEMVQDTMHVLVHADPADVPRLQGKIEGALLTLSLVEDIIGVEEDNG